MIIIITYMRVHKIYNCMKMCCIWCENKVLRMKYIHKPTSKKYAYP